MFEMGRFSLALAAFPAAVIKSLGRSNKGRNEGMKKGFGFWLTTVPGCRVYHEKVAASHMCQNRQQFMQHAHFPFSTYIIREWHTQWVGLPTSMKARYPTTTTVMSKGLSSISILPGWQLTLTITLPYRQSWEIKGDNTCNVLTTAPVIDRLVHSLHCHCWDSSLRLYVTWSLEGCDSP